MKFYVSAIRAMTVPTLALLGSIACAAPVTVQVSDTSGLSLADVAGYAEPASGQAAPKSVHTTEIEQIGRKFSPLVAIIQTGGGIQAQRQDRRGRELGILDALP
jgi:hypothetical protein